MSLAHVVLVVLCLLFALGNDLLLISEIRVFHFLIDLLKRLGIHGKLGHDIDVRDGQFFLQVFFFILLQLKCTFPLQTLDIIDGVLRLGVTGLGGLLTELNSFNLDFQFLLKSAIGVHEKLIENVGEFNLHLIDILN